MHPSSVPTYHKKTVSIDPRFKPKIKKQLTSNKCSFEVDFSSQSEFIDLGKQIFSKLRERQLRNLQKETLPNLESF